MSNTVDLAQCLNHFGADYLQTHSLSPEQAKAWRAIVNCHTPTLGGHRLEWTHAGTASISTMPAVIAIVPAVRRGLKMPGRGRA